MLILYVTLFGQTIFRIENEIEEIEWTRLSHRLTQRRLIAKITADTKNRLGPRPGTLFGVDTLGWNVCLRTENIIYGDSYGPGPTYIMSCV